MTSRWFYNLMGESFGPVDWAQVQELVETGILATSDRVCAENSTDWQTIHQVADHNSAPRATDHSLDLQLAESLDDIQLEPGPSTIPVNDLSQQFHAVADLGSVVELTSVQAKSAAEIQYYVQVFGEILGPVSRPDLGEMIADQQVGGEDLVRVGKDGAWQPIEKMPLLQRYLSTAPTEPPTRSVNQVDATPVARGVSSALADAPRDKAVPRKAVTQKAVAESAPTRVRTSAQPSRKKSKRPPKPKYDPIMQEIYDEVFAPDATAKAPRPGQNEARVAAAPVTTAAGSPREIDSRPASNPTSPAISALSPTQTMPREVAIPVPPAPGRTAPSFQLPDGKTLGIGAALLGVSGLILAFMMGWVSLPSFGGGSTGPTAESSVIACYMEFNALPNPVAQIDWVEFTGTVQGRIKPLMSKQDAGTDASVIKAAQLLLDIADSHPIKDAAKITQFSTQLKTLMEQIRG
ncbi:MAG: DUF4339 domain-containing protein [Planctomycetaceae bacterium]